MGCQLSGGWLPRDGDPFRGYAACFQRLAQRYGIPLFRGRSRELSIVVLTVFEDDDKLLRAICAGADGYLLKPNRVERLCSLWLTRWRAALRLIR